MGQMTQAPEARRAAPQPVDLATAARMAPADVVAALGSTSDGLSAAAARQRLADVGPNALRTHGASAPAVLLRQLKNPILILLLAAALTSAFVGERTDSVIIFLICGLSIGLGFVNEYRSERAVEALHSQLRHLSIARRDGSDVAVDVTQLVPGDVVRLAVGDVVPADLRLLEANGLECDESVLTGESMPADKEVEAAAAAASSSPLDLPSCALHGNGRPHRQRRRRRRRDRDAHAARADRRATRRAASRRRRSRSGCTTSRRCSCGSLRFSR